MSKRNTQQRRHTIMALLTEQGEVSVDMLAKRFETSEVTIRKDLAELERNGLLLRRYGGAVLIPSELVEESGEEEQLSVRKQAIAALAASLIRDHNRLIIDAGSTTAGLIPQLGRFRGLVVMTNSMQVASALRELEVEPTILMTGGTWDPHSSLSKAKWPSRSYALMILISYLSALPVLMQRAVPPPSMNWWGYRG
ncbi:DeoR/GlpR family DNA-binding transcription regulator [Plesiomonas shigelloides subsp. oncorhynchi]|nr:DeoR/GlpR family DNA-binding transcription regulator [Plesiomonas shigelloides]